MPLGDLIRAIKADLKHDDNIVYDYDWERLRSYKNIGRLDELMEIIEGLKTNERFLALPYFPIEEDENSKSLSWEQIATSIVEFLGVE